MLFPESSYFIGFSSERNSTKEDIEALLIRLEDYSRKLLIESIQVTIKSISAANIENINGKTHEHFKQTSLSVSKVSIAGLKTEKYYDQKEKYGYAITYVKKQEVADLYENVIINKTKNVQQKILTAENALKENNKQEAIRLFYECHPIFMEIEEAQSLMIAMGYYAEDKLKIDKLIELQNKVGLKISELQLKEQLSLDDACYFIAFGLFLQTDEISDKIYLHNFSYQDTEMGSEFSNRLRMNLQNKFISVANYNINTGNNLSEENNDLKDSNFSILGTFWEEDSILKIIVLLKNTEERTMVASAESKIPLEWLERNKIPYKPENFDQAYSNLQAFDQKEFVGQGLIINVWTNQGNENLIFSGGDTLRLFIRANKECYVRFIYHQADDTKVLLLDNYYIDSEKVNKVYELPYMFQCTEPYGAEILQVNAQTKPFSPLSTNYEYGYNFILDDLDGIFSINRGFKPMNNEDLSAEKRMIITTINKCEQYY